MFEFYSFINNRLFFVCFLFWDPHLQHVEVPRLGVKSELQLLATVTATWDPSHICDLHHNSLQCRWNQQGGHEKGGGRPQGQVQRREGGELLTLSRRAHTLLPRALFSGSSLSTLFLPHNSPSFFSSVSREHCLTSPIPVSAACPSAFL